MEDAAVLSNYLPLSFKTSSEQKYIAFQWDAFETNYTHGNYQFAFLADHMLTMNFVYFNIWRIRQTRSEDFEKSLIGFGKGIEKSPHPHRGHIRKSLFDLWCASCLCRQSG